MSGYQGLNSNGKTVSGVASTPTLVEFEIADGYATPIYNGDPVAFTNGLIVQCLGNTTTLTPVGVLRGIRYIDALGQVQRLHYYPASTTNTGTLDFAGGVTGNVVALVELAQDALFTIDSSGTAMTQAMIGATFQLAGVGTQIGATGRSAATVAVNTAATVGTQLAGVRIHRIAPIPGNQAIGGTGATLEVSFIESFGDAT
jgi:hypothetical protein